MSKKNIALAIIGILVVILVVAAFVVDSKFAVVRKSPVISHATLVTPQTRVQAVVNLPRITDLVTKIIKKQVQPAQKAPDWAIQAALPYEAALVCNLDPATKGAKASLFVNDQRLGPVLCNLVNSASLPDPFAQWFTTPAAVKDRGVIQRDGAIKLDASVVEKIKPLWKNTEAPSEALTVGSDHAVEILLDNRDGGATTILLTVLTQVASDLDYSMGLTILPSIASVRVQADFATDNSLKIHLEIACTKEQEAMMGFFTAMLETGIGKLKPMLKAQGIMLDGKLTVKDLIVSYDAAIPNAEQVLLPLLGL